MDWFRVELDRVVEETPVDRTLVLALPPDRAESFRFRPGQHIQVRIPPEAGDAKGIYSLSSGPGDPDVQITIRMLGKAGQALASLQGGDALDITMPRGNHPLDANTDEEAPDEGARRRVLVAEGAGVAPLRSYVRQLRELGHDGDVTLVQSDDQEAHLVFREEFERHERECPWFSYRPTLGGVDAELLGPLVRPAVHTVVFAVGSSAFVDSTLQLARELGVPNENLSRERWG